MDQGTEYEAIHYALKQRSRRILLRVAGWGLFALGLIGTVMFGYTAANSEKMVDAMFKVEVRQRNLRIVDQEAFDRQKARAVEQMQKGSVVMTINGAALLVCGLFIGLLKSPAKAAMALLVIYTIGAVAVFAVGGQFKPLAVIWRLLMILVLILTTALAIGYQRAVRAAPPDSPVA